MNGYDIYRKLTVGGTGAMTYQGATDDTRRWAKFAEKLRWLDEMEAQGLIEIFMRHKEQQSGLEHVDMVLFRRLR